MKGKTLWVVFFGVALAAFAQDVQSVEAPEPSDDSVTNGPVDAPMASDQRVDVNAIEPQDAPSLEADGQTDDAPEVPSEEFEAAPAVEAEPAPGIETGDAPDLP